MISDNCPPGFAYDESGSGSDLSGTLCEKCPVGSYKPLEGNTNCTSCPEGTTTERTGALVDEQCSM